MRQAKLPGSRRGFANRGMRKAGLVLHSASRPLGEATPHHQREPQEILPTMYKQCSAQNDGQHTHTRTQRQERYTPVMAHVAMFLCAQPLLFYPLLSSSCMFFLYIYTRHLKTMTLYISSQTSNPSGSAQLLHWYLIKDNCQL